MQGLIRGYQPQPLWQYTKQVGHNWLKSKKSSFYIFPFSLSMILLYHIKRGLSRGFEKNSRVFFSHFLLPLFCLTAVPERTIGSSGDLTRIFPLNNNSITHWGSFVNSFLQKSFRKFLEIGAPGLFASKSVKGWSFTETRLSAF